MIKIIMIRLIKKLRQNFFWSLFLIFLLGGSLEKANGDMATEGSLFLTSNIFKAAVDKAPLTAVSLWITPIELAGQYNEPQNNSAVGRAGKSTNGNILDSANQIFDNILNVNLLNQTGIGLKINF